MWGPLIWLSSSISLQNYARPHNRAQGKWCENSVYYYFFKVSLHRSLPPATQSHPSYLTPPTSPIPTSDNRGPSPHIQHGGACGSSPNPSHEEGQSRLPKGRQGLEGCAQRGVHRGVCTERKASTPGEPLLSPGNNHYNAAQLISFHSVVTRMQQLLQRQC